MTYLEKLKTEDWKIMRIQIIQRDNYTCQSCKKLGYDECLVIVGIEENGNILPLEEPDIVPIPDEDSLELNVHHKCYRKGKDPWDYPSTDLITLCPECHKKIHEEFEIPVLNDLGNIITHAKKCNRCNGFGYIPKYAHFQAGICFDCWGEGVSLNNIF